MSKGDKQSQQIASAIKSQAVIVLTEMSDGTIVIRADNNGRNNAAKLADAVAKCAYEIMQAGIRGEIPPASPDAGK